MFLCTHIKILWLRQPEKANQQLSDNSLVGCDVCKNWGNTKIPNKEQLPCESQAFVILCIDKYFSYRLGFTDWKNRLDRDFRKSFSPCCAPKQCQHDFSWFCGNCSWRPPVIQTPRQLLTPTLYYLRELGRFRVVLVATEVCYCVF